MEDSQQFGINLFKPHSLPRSDPEIKLWLCFWGGGVCCNLQRIKRGAVLNWCSPSSSERSGSRIKRFSPLHPLLKALHSSFFNVQCFIDPPEVCFSHSTFNVMKHAPDKIWSAARVVYWASSQRCPPGRTIKLHRYAASSIKTRCKSSAALRRKTDAWIEARPAISCLISQPPVPRCPCVCSTSLFYFSQALICFWCLLNAVSCLTQLAMSVAALRLSLWQKQWIKVFLYFMWPIPSKRMLKLAEQFLHDVLSFLYLWQISRSRAVTENKSDLVIFPFSNLSSFPL